MTLLLIFSVDHSNGAERFEEMSTGDMFYTKGLVSSVSPRKLQFAVRPLKGKRVVIEVDPDTIYEGVKQLEELLKKQQVKVWYRIDNEKNKAVKVKKMMELGC